MRLFSRKRRVRISDIESSYKPKARAGIVCEHKLIEATVKIHERWYSHQPGHVVNTQCGKTARCKIEGRNYCRGHAGMVALELLRGGVCRRA